MTDKIELTPEQIAEQKAQKAQEKASKAEAKAKEKVERAEAKTKEAEEKKAEREANKVKKAKEREDAKLAKKAEREANRMPEQNGIRRPKPKTLCGKVWELADNLSGELKQPVPIKNLLESGAKFDLNEGNVKAEYARWRKFNGVVGRVSLPKEEVKKEEKS